MRLLVCFQLSGTLLIEGHQMWDFKLFVEVMAEEEELVGQLELLVLALGSARPAGEVTEQLLRVLSDHKLPDDKDRNEE